MRLLLVSPSFPPMRSGGADFAYGLCERWVEQGLRVHVITSALEGLVTNSAFTIAPVMKQWSWPELPRLLSEARRFRPDVINIHFAGSLYHHHSMVAFLPTILKAVLDHPLLVVNIEYPEMIRASSLRRINRVLGKLTRLAGRPMSFDYGYGRLLRDADRIVVLSESHRPLLESQSPGAAEKCCVIGPPPALNLCADPDGAIRRAERERLSVGPDDTLAAYYGYIYPNKGIETLIEAFGLLFARRRDVFLVMVGGVNEIVLRIANRPNYLRELQEQAERAGIGRHLIWTDYTPPGSDQPSRLLRAADLCVLPFDDGILMHRSTVGVALAHGLPIVSTRGPILESVFVEGENVLLCPPKDPAAFAEALETVITDVELRARLRRGSQRLGEERFSWRRCIEQTISIFHGEPVA